ncbi:MAG: asparagine synthase (glutamine-hydrolyzing) [Planctomycetes bacterium]|nr:asparagine synthase (glutamine-hydrolyzing) [Planctomycetota bacterium]
MCGIAGIVDLRGSRSIEPGIARRMAAAIVHRGPDEDGYFDRPNLALSSRRLSIVGLQDGRQPITNEDGSIAVVYNGELFDYPERRADLVARGHVFRTHCDTELIPHLYEDHGEEMLDKLRGQFALALWDERRQRLILARDRFGICPLYWTRQTGADGDRLLFASEIKALLASGLVRAEPDPRGINHAFTFFAMPGPVTCFAGVQILLPGHYLVIDLVDSGAAVVREKIFWQIDFPDRGQEERGDPRRVVDEFEQIFQAAVDRRLRADVPVVSYLSGGVDSSVVVAHACHLRRQEGKSAIPTFTISIQDPELNERSEAGIVSRHLGARPVIVDCGPSEILNAYPQLIRAAEGPVIDTACAALLLLAREVHAQGYKVALTGEGADEWLAGYPWYKVHKLLGFLDIIPGLGKLVRRAYLRFSGAPRFPWSMVKRVHEAVGGANAWLDIYGLFSASKLRLFSADMWERLGDHIPYADLQLNLERARRWHPLNRSLYLGARVMLPGLLLASKGDRVAMNSSVETRYPFLDEEVYAFLAKLHPRWKMRGFRDKYILRKMAERWVPREIAWRRKAMFRAPFDAFHADPKDLPPFVEQLLSPESLARTGYFDVDNVRHWRDAYRRLRAGSAQRTMIEMGLVGVISTQLWHHTYIDSSLADLPGIDSSARQSEECVANLQSSI